VPVVTNSCAFLFAREAAGAFVHRHSLCPLVYRGTRRCITRAHKRAAGMRRLAEKCHVVIPEAAQRLSGIHLSTCVAARRIPGLRLQRKIASLFCRGGASRNDGALIQHGCFVVCAHLRKRFTFVTGHDEALDSSTLSRFTLVGRNLEQAAVRIAAID
jgi:hypothetical protein